MVKNNRYMDDFDISNYLREFPFEKDSYNFIKECMRINVSDRISYKNILSHPFLQ